MVKPMPASEHNKNEVGNVGDVGDLGDVKPCFSGGEDKVGDVGDVVDGASVWDEVVCLPAMRLPKQR